MGPASPYPGHAAEITHDEVLDFVKFGGELPFELCVGPHARGSALRPGRAMSGFKTGALGMVMSSCVQQP